MNYNKNETGQAQAQNEQCEVLTFQFSESRQPVRNFIENNQAWFVAMDVCNVLGLSNHKVAIKALDEDEKGVRKVYPLDGKGGLQSTNVISESGLYALILRSNKPYARTFRKWITSEVIPTLQRKGHYGSVRPSVGDYVDARNVPYTAVDFNGSAIRCITLDSEAWYSVNDLNRALHSTTGSNQIVKKLNAIELLAIKIWLFGNTHPAWFTNRKGVALVLAGSRVNRSHESLQLSLDFDRKEGGHGNV